MGVLDAFLSTWSNARNTFGQGTPQSGDGFDQSATLDGLAAQLESAAPGAQWTGTAAAAYGTVNTEHRRVIGQLADLDRRLRHQIDMSAHVVSTGRTGLDEVRRWVTDAAASVPGNAAGERMLVPIVQKGIGEVMEIVSRSNSELNTIGATIRRLGDEYVALGDQKFGGGGQPGETPADGEPTDPYEQALRDAGLLDGPPPDGLYKEWLDNAERQGVPPETIVDIARRHNITPSSFAVLKDMPRVRDPDGKTFFQLPKGTSGEDARKAVLMTYIFNAGTDYGDGTATDFTPEPYSADEVQRIIDRQDANSWTYDEDVPFILNADGTLMTTPNGMLMGMGGNWVQDQFSWKGGTAWGDIFMENIDHGHNPTEQLTQIIESGKSWNVGDNGVPKAGSLDLDRLLHHEEMHSRQWADKGYFGMLWAAISDSDGIEKEAGLGDGGYK
ncbi:EspA/EspE family type VII secretion system effector [Mycobacterium sp. C31M]